MASRRRKKRPLRPRVPSRVKKRTTRRRTQSHHQNELLGLGLAALGLVLATILYLGFDGGAVGSWLAQALEAVLGGAAYALPLVLVGVGGLMLARSDLLDVRPFRLGLGVGFLGLMTLLGRDDNGGWIGLALGGVLAGLIGGTGAVIVGGTLLLGGALLVSGASTGAILRRTGHVVRRAGTGARRAFDWVSTETQTQESYDSVPERVEPPRRLLDGAEAYPDVVGAISSENGSLLAAAELEAEPAEESLASVFETSTEHAEYRLPDRGILRSSPATPAKKGDADVRTADLLVRTLTEFGVDATVSGQISGPRVTRYELQLAPGTKVAKVAALKDDLSYALATTEIRILAPIPGKQAVGVEVPNVSPRLVTLGDIFDDVPGDGEPALGLAREGHLRELGLDRPRADAAPPHRRHDRLGQVGLHQHDPHLDASPRDTRRGADDPDRPEADRARLLRVDPAPAHVGRLQPEGGGDRAHERRRGDGTTLRAALARPRAQPARRRTGRSAPAGRRRCRTCSWSSTSSPT